MRDFVLFVVIVGSIPVAFLKPYVGIYLWYWIGLMNPHRLTWGFMHSFPVAQIVGIATLLGALFVPRRAPVLRAPETILLFALAILFTINTVVALFPGLAQVEWQRVMKVLLMTYLTVALINDRSKLRMLIMVVVLSVGFVAVKGAMWGLFTGGQYRLWGPESSSLADNNSLGLALDMVLPLAFFLARNEKRAQIRLLFYGVSLSCLFGVVLTYSRGALVGLVPVLAMLLYRTRKSVPLVLALIGACLCIMTFLPSTWFDRMETIGTYGQDQSAMQRIETWQFAWELAIKRPLTGGGFEGFRANPTDRNPHSIYYGVLGEQGFLAFGLFLLLLAVCYQNLGRLSKSAARRPEFKWYAECAGMLRVSLVGYAVSGAFLNLQYFDLFYLIVALAVIARHSFQVESAALTALDQSAAGVLLSPQASPFGPPRGASPGAAPAPRTGR